MGDVGLYPIDRFLSLINFTVYHHQVLQTLFHVCLIGAQSLLGQYLKRTDPGFSPATYGHSGLLDMLKTYDLLTLKKEEGGHYTVGLRQAGAMEGAADGGRG